jgi:hypothetical protein
MGPDERPIDQRGLLCSAHSSPITLHSMRCHASAPQCRHSLAMLVRLSAATLILAAAGCNDVKVRRQSPSASQSSDVGWVRLPSSREATCTDTAWVCAKWKDQEWERRSLYLTGTTAFVTLRAVDGSFTERLQVSCPAATYRIVWESPSMAFDTLAMPTWIPMTDRWERALWGDVCTNGGPGRGK